MLCNVAFGAHFVNCYCAEDAAFFEPEVKRLSHVSLKHPSCVLNRPYGRAVKSECIVGFRTGG